MTWRGVGRDDDDTPRRTRPVRSRLTGADRFLAPWYRALFPMPPHEVRRLRPQEAAAILGLDLDDTIHAVPLEDAPFVPRQGDPNAPRQVRVMR